MGWGVSNCRLDGGRTLSVGVAMIGSLALTLSVVWCGVGKGLSRRYLCDDC